MKTIKICKYCQIEKEISAFPTQGLRCKECLAADARERRKSDAFVSTPVDSEYATWKNIKQKCSNPNNPAYDNYGGRGIKVCERWNESYDKFLEDMGRRPIALSDTGFPLYSIERIDNNGNYEPDNCEWATRKKQMNNTRKNNTVIINGSEHTISELHDNTGIHPETLRSRIKAGKVGEDLIAPERKAVRYEYNEKSYTLEELSSISGFHQSCLYKRIVKKGMSVQEAVETPAHSLNRNIKP